MILHLKASHFRIDFWSKFHACSKRLPKPLFSTRWPPKCTNKSPYWIFWAAFGTPSDFQGPQKGAQNRPSKPESLKKSIRGAHFLGSWNRTFALSGFQLPIAARASFRGWSFRGLGFLPGAIFTWFARLFCIDFSWPNVECFLMDFPQIVDFPP